MYRNKGCLNWWERTIKMVTAEKLSMAGELLCDLRAQSYDTCLSNLTKNHCVNLKKFNRDRLPEGTWITCKRFLTNSNHVMPNALFDLFGEFRSIVHDNMVGWAFDNYRLLENVCKIAMEQCKMILCGWINEMASEQTPGDEIVHFIKNVSETCICIHPDVLVDDPLVHMASTGKRTNGQVRSSSSVHETGCIW